MTTEMTIGRRLSQALAASRPRFDPVQFLLRADAAYRERRRIEELTPEQLRDIGLTSEDASMLLRRR
jgi:uncharacterized protein YjiS (DUF1127 family)